MLTVIIYIVVILSHNGVYTLQCISIADLSGRAVYGVGLRPLACWDCGFESREGHGCLSVVSVVCCQTEVCASG